MSNNEEKDKKIALDVQIRYKMIEKLSAMNQELKDEIVEHKETERQLISVNESLEKALKVKTDFLSTLSHETRTPLNIILGYLQVLETSPIGQEYSEYLTAIKIAADGMLNMIDQILNYSKLTSQKETLNLTTFELKDVVGEFKKLFKVKAIEKKLQYKFLLDSEIPELLIGDLGKLKQVLYNTIGNAIKYTDEGFVEVCFICKNKTDKDLVLVLEVKDSGRGIAKDDLGRIFSKFTQLEDSTKRTKNGVGLGLAICKEIVDLMEGTIKVDSILDKGTTFSVEIPLEYKLKEQNPKNTRNAEPLKNLHVLLAEDNLMNQRMALIVLKMLGCEVKVANNGQEAVNLCVEESFDIILMDLHMPILNGFEATEQIKRMGIETPVIAFSADVLAETQERITALGIAGFISKPFVINDLSTSIKKVISRSLAMAGHLRRSLRAQRTLEVEESWQTSEPEASYISSKDSDRQSSKESGRTSSKDADSRPGTAALSAAAPSIASSSESSSASGFRSVAFTPRRRIAA